MSTTYTEVFAGGTLIGGNITLRDRLLFAGGTNIGGDINVSNRMGVLLTGGMRFGGDNNGTMTFLVSTEGGARSGSKSRMFSMKPYNFVLDEPVKNNEFHPINLEVPNRAIRKITDSNDILLPYFVRFRDNEKIGIMVRMNIDDIARIEVITSQEIG